MNGAGNASGGGTSEGAEGGGGNPLLVCDRLYYRAGAEMGTGELVVFLLTMLVLYPALVCLLLMGLWYEEDL